MFVSAAVELAPELMAELSVIDPAARLAFTEAGNLFHSASSSFFVRVTAANEARYSLALQDQRCQSDSGDILRILGISVHRAIVLP